MNRILDIVIRKLGNVEVAQRLNTTPVLIDMWLKGQAHMPETEFHRLVDLLIELDPGWEDWDQQ